MSRRHFYILKMFVCCVLFGLTSCDFSLSALSNNGDERIEVKRLDRLEYHYVTTGDFHSIQLMSTDYPTETRTLIEDVLKIGEVSDLDINKRFVTFFQDSTLLKLCRDTEEKFANMESLNNELTEAFKNLKKLLPETDIPMVYTQIGALGQSVVVKDGSIGISLDKYLGTDYPLYKEHFDDWSRSFMSKEYIAPDCLLFYLIYLYPLENYETAPQEVRDWQFGKLGWIVNQALGKRVNTMEPIVKMEEYMRKHPEITASELLKEHASRNNALPD